MIASIIAGLSSIPFTASTVLDDYDPISQTTLNMSNTNEITGKLTRSMTSDSFEQSYQTPFGEFVISVHSDIIKQELIRPDRKVVVKETPELTEWKLTTQNYTLTLQKTGFKQEEKFTSPDGYLEKIKEMGNKTTEVKGDASKVQKNYLNAKDLLEKELGRMEEIKKKYTRLPMQDLIYINEFLSNDDNDEVEWVELYNPKEEEVDIEAWTLGDETNPEDMDLSGTIPPLSYKLINDTSFSLNNDGDIIYLKNEEGSLVDKVAYGNKGSVPKPPQNNSTGRNPDGSENWKIFDDPTPGESNA